MSPPRTAAPPSERKLVHDAVVRLRSRVMALVFGMVGGVGLFLTTVWHVIRNGQRQAPDIGLLNNYFPGYSVSWTGALIGLLYGAATGAVLGWVVAWVYNRVALRREES